MQLDQFEPHQILEYRLASAQQEARLQPSEDFLEELASGKPTPGGGSAAAYSAAAGAALVAMTARLTIGKKKYAAVEAQMQEILAQAERLRNELRSAIRRDSDSFEAVVKAMRLAKDTPEQNVMRHKAIQEATLAAAQAPLETARMAVEVIELAQQAVALGNLNALSDAATGAALARAGLAGAGYNVRINVAALSDRSLGESLLIALGELERRAEALESQIRNHLVGRGGFPLS
jgi:formiminotetrahydrofolate cyclodeaminase